MGDVAGNSNTSAYKTLSRSGSLRGRVTLGSARACRQDHALSTLRNVLSRSGEANLVVSVGPVGAKRESSNYVHTTSGTKSMRSQYVAYIVTLLSIQFRN